MSLHKRIVLITAYWKNTGAECARHFSTESAELIWHDNPEQIRIRTLHYHEKVLELMNCIRISVHAGDLATMGTLQQLFSGVPLEHGTIDVVVDTSSLAHEKPNLHHPAIDHDNLSAYVAFVDEQRRKTANQYNELIRKMDSSH